MPKNCCKTVKITFKKSDDKNQPFLTFKHKVVDPIKDFVAYPVTTPIHKIKYRLVALVNYRLRPPPHTIPGRPLYISYSVFRI